MDCRLTLDAGKTFLESLQRAHIEKEKIFLIFDENGMTRTEGFITAFHPREQEIIVELENGLQIPVKKIIALNGTFLPQYAEC